MEKELTPMQEFALKMLKEKGELNPGYLAHLWAYYSTGRYLGSSRRAFGFTTAAYKTLRKLNKKGLVKQVGSYSIEKYQLA